MRAIRRARARRSVATICAAVTLTAVGAVPTSSAAEAAELVAPASTWVVRPSTTQPPNLDDPSVTYDGARQVVVLFGGDDPLAAPSAQTWTWSGTDWTHRFPVTSPPARYGAGMVYDASRQRVILFGGRDDNDNPLADTWSWDGTTWTQLYPAASPLARSHMGMTYDAVRQHIVLFGGSGSSAALGDTWSWDGTTWTQQAPSMSPAPRTDPSMAYDPATQTTVMFGGGSSDPSLSPNETWTWNGSTWAHMAPPTSPPSNYAQSLSYDYPVDDPGGRLILLTGGRTWSWDGLTWTEHVTADAPLSGTLVYSGTAQTVMAFVPYNANGRTWTYRSTAEEFGTVSTVAPLDIPLSETFERPDLVSARLAARLSGHRVEVTANRTETTSTFVNPDGSETQELFPGPIRLLRDGVWIPVDTTLEKSGGVVRPKAAAADVSFSAGGTGPAARLVSDGRVFALNWPTALPEPVLVGSTATYPEVAPGTDLVLEATSIGFEQSLRLRHRSTTPPTFRFPLTLQGFDLVQTVAGDLRLTDSTSGEVVAAGGAPRMWGTGTDLHTGEPLRSSLVQTSLVEVSGTTELRLTPDPVFLADPTVVYPVTIDPASNLTRASDTFIDTGYSSNQTSSGELRAGTWTSGQAARSLMTFSTSALTGKHILSANLKLYNYHSYSCTKKAVSAYQITSAWSPSTVTWTNGAPSVASSPVNTQTVAYGYSGCGANWVNWDMRSLVQAWANGTANYGVSIRASESDVLGWKKFCSGETGSSSCPSTSYAPRLAVTYNSYPKTPTSPLPASASYTNLSNVPLSAVVTDPDGGSVRGRFTVRTPSGQTLGEGSGSLVTSGSRSTYYQNVSISGDGTYQWRVRAFDGTDTSGYIPSATTWYTVIVDRAAPAAPVVSSSAFSAGTWTATTSGTFTWTEASTDVTSYLYGIDTPTPTTVTTSRNTPTLTVAPGWHTFYVRSKDRAGNLSTVSAYQFGVGVGTVTSPADEDRTQASTSLMSVAPTTKSHVSYWYRPGTTGSFAQVPAAHVTYPGTTTNPTWPVARGTDGTFPDLTWNVSQTVATDGLVQVEACFHTSATDNAPTCSPPNDLQLAKHAFGASYATQALGPGQLSLLTGDYSVSATDVSVPTYQGSLSIGRSLTTLAPAGSGIFGPGWTPDLPGPEAGAADLALDDRTSSGGYVELVGPDGESAIYVKNAGSTYPYTYTGLGDAAADGYALTKNSASQFTLKDESGTTTVWTYRTFTGAPANWVVDYVAEPSSSSTSSYTYDAVTGRITRILGPVPPGVSCTSGLVAGCRALTLNYATSTTATGMDAAGFGDVNGQLSSVDFTSFDPVSAAMNTVRVATYRYDSTGRLRQEWDPRLGATAATGLATTYEYDATGRLASLTPAGLAPWTFGYDASGRLVTVTRTDGVTPSTETVVYGVPFTGTGAPVDVGASAAAAWGQRDLAATATAVFRPDHVPAAAPTESDYQYSTIHYLDANGREVNTATHGMGWYVATSEYDQHGNVVRTLSARNRDEALNPTRIDPAIDGLADSTARAAVLDTDSVFSPDGTMLLDTYGPAHEVLLDDGSVVVAREHTHNEYDAGAPAGGPYRLLTSTTTSASVETTSGRVDHDSHVTTTGYDAVVAGDTTGWVLRKPTNTHTVLGGAAPDIVRFTRYDPEGRVVETRMPKAVGNTDAHTQVSTYYSAGANATYPACGGQPGLAGLLCRVGPAVQPASGQNLPVVTYAYNQFDQTLSTVETVGSTTRATTTTYDAAGRQQTRSVVVTPAVAGGTAVPAVTFGYDAATGLPTTTSTTTGGVTTTLTTGYDTFGRVTRVVDADGNVTTTTYDVASRPATVNDGKRTTTYTYDGQWEHRGLLTRLNVGFAAGVPSEFSAEYDADGQLARETYPNGVIATWRRDGAGALRTLRYDVEDVNGEFGRTEWMTFDEIPDVSGDVRQATSPGSKQEYSYDAAGRLTEVADTDATGDTVSCATRRYAYDADSNRTGLTEYLDPTESCSTAGTPTTVSHAYDDADRLVDAGFAYDAFGRTTTVPAAAGGSALAVGYYADDMVASQSAAGRTMSWTLDPARRLRTWTDTADGKVRTNHYGDTDDSPGWIGVSDGSWSRNVAGIDGNLAAVEVVGADGVAAVALQFTNPHGDVVATSANSSSAIGIDGYVESTEFGNARSTNVSRPRYGWLGGKQRSADALGALVLMGVRLYSPALGRFLQVDPVPGGSANAYEYAGQDPINHFDLDGRWKIKWRKIFKTAVTVIGYASVGACIVASAGLCAAAATVAWAASSSYRLYSFAADGEYRKGLGAWGKLGVGLALDYVSKRAPGVRQRSGGSLGRHALGRGTHRAAYHGVRKSLRTRGGQWGATRQASSAAWTRFGW